MRKFGFYILALLIMVVILMFFLDKIYTYSYTHGIPRNKVSYVLSLDRDTINYVFLGSSRVDNFIDAGVIESETKKKALNLGIQGAKIYDYYLMLQLLQQQKINIDSVFIQVDYVFNMEGDSEILKSFLMPFIESKTISSFIKERDPDYWKLKYIPFYRYLVYDYKLGFREFFSTAINKPSKTNFENGYFPKFGNSGEKMGLALPPRIKESNKGINAINEFAEKNNIKIVYFIAPVCSGTKNLDYSKKLQNKLSPFLDFSSIFLEHDEYFFNCGHLNDKGAQKFSKIMTDTITSSN